MTTIALVGGDGSGKTTIARRLEKSLPWPGKYLYMGTSVFSSDSALFTTRLARRLKLYLYRKNAGNNRQGEPSSNDLHYGSEKRGPIWVAARFLNRLAEAWWRQLLTFLYQLRGYVVIFDRHFLFQVEDRENSRVSCTFEHLEQQILHHFYPRPDLVIFLDAPPEVLYRRKGEATLEILGEQRESILEQGKKVRNFVIVDAGRQLEEVVDEVRKTVIAFRAKKL